MVRPAAAKIAARASFGPMFAATDAGEVVAVSAKLGPEPLPSTIARAHVREHRNLSCSSYDACLDRAAHEDWASWTCANCARFDPPPSVPGRHATLSPIGGRGDAIVAGPQTETGTRARVRSSSASTLAARNGPPDRTVPAHLVEQEKGTVHVRLDAPCMTALFIEAARAVAEMVRGRPLVPAAEWAEDVSVMAPDPEHLLVAWMAELLVRSERSKTRFTEFDIVYLSERHVVASVRGVRLGHVRSPVKSSTYHDPSLVDRRDHVSATPVLDM